MSLVVTGVGIADTRDTFVTRPLPEVVLSFAGIEGDRHAGLNMAAGVRQPWFPRGAQVKNTRQISIVSIEELAEIAASMKLPHVSWEHLGANLCVSGLEKLTALPAATRLIFPSGACLFVDGDNQPCVGPGKQIAAAMQGDAKLASSFVNASRDKRGLVAWVERPGLVRQGDQIALSRSR